jgi:glycosyltransferase involved in cell wall biosynthesis
VRIVIYARNIVSMDGVGNSCLYFQGLCSRLFARDVLLVSKDGSDLPSLDVDSYLTSYHSKEDILIYHYSIEDEAREKLLNSEYRFTVIYYHGITDPILSPVSERTATACQLGLSAIPSLPSFDLYLTNSLASLQQYNSFVDHSQDFHIVPPVLLRAKQIKYLQPSINQPSRALRFYYVGSFSEHKRVDILADAVGSGSQHQLFIFSSSNPERIELLNGNTRGYYRLDDVTMRAMIMTMDAFVTASTHEGFCIPAIEAVMMGMPALLPDLNCFHSYLPANYFYMPVQISASDLEEIYWSLQGKTKTLAEYTCQKVNLMYSGLEERLRQLA